MKTILNKGFLSVFLVNYSVEVDVKSCLDLDCETAQTCLCSDCLCCSVCCESCLCPMATEDQDKKLAQVLQIGDSQYRYSNVYNLI